MKNLKIYQAPQILVLTCQTEGHLLANTIYGAMIHDTGTNKDYNFPVDNTGTSTITDEDLNNGDFAKSYGSWDDLGNPDGGGIW